MTGLLTGMRVLDLSVWRPMPHATQILADLGAEVLKVEPPGGDPMRSYPEIFASVARGKRSIELDLRSDNGRDRALQLAAESDVVCEGWRPGVAGRLGVDYESVRAVNPSVIYCSLSGYGQDGPMRDAPGHDVNYQAVAGALVRRGEEDRDPELPRLPVADLEGGTVCAVLICAAWARRIASGEGERIDMAMSDAVAWWVGTSSGTAHEATESRTHGSPGYGIFRTADDKLLAIGVLAEQRLWDAICRGLGDALADLEGVPFETRLPRTPEINERVAAEIARLDHAAALARLSDAGAPVSPVLAPEETPTFPQFALRELHVETDAGLVAALPGRLRSGGRPAPTQIPKVGEHPEGFTPR